MMNLLQLYNDAYRSVLSRIKALDGSLLLRRIGWNLLITVAFALFTSLRKEQGDYYMSVFIPLFGATSAITLIGCLFKAPTVISMIYSLLITMGAAIQIFARSGEDSMSFAHRYVILIYIALVVALVALPLLKKLTMSGKLKSIRWGLMAAIVVLFVAVLVFGDEQNGAKSWINLGWFSIQITEITKLLQLVLLSVVLADRALSEQTRFFWCIASLVVAGLFYFLASELGTLLLYGIAHFVLRLLFAEKRQWVFAEIGVVSVVLVVGLLSCYLIYKNHTPVLENTESIQTETTDTQEPVDTGLMSRLAKIWPKLTKRFNVFIDTSDSADAYQRDIANRHLSMGTWFGTPEGSLASIPHIKSDFIFVFVLLRLGIIGAALVFLSYLLLLANVFIEAGRTGERRQLESVMACSFICAMVIAVIICAAYCLGVFPIVGLPFPLISHGGSALAVNLVIAVYSIYFLRMQEVICREE